MADFLFGTITSLAATLFTANDKLTFLESLDDNNVSVSSNGITTTLNSLGTSVTLPADALSQSSNEGNIAFSNGTELDIGTNSDNMFDVRGSNNDSRGFGLAGNDSFLFGNGNDVAYGGAGNDTIDGGGGNDHLYGYGASAGVDGDDQIHGGSGNDYIQGNSGADTLYGDAGNDRIYGGADNDSILGGDGNDTINGNFGEDNIDGGAGNDVIRGGKGNDVINGGSGDDVISGDLGADTLTGGSGADLFRFTGSDATTLSTDSLLGHIDTITDFTIGTDHIALGFTPNEILHGTTSGTLDQVLAYAQQLLNVAGLTGGHDVAAVTFGSDTVLFYSSTGSGLVADSVVTLQGVNEANVSTHDFI